MKNEYFQNDVIDLRILDDIGSVCIYRFPPGTLRQIEIWEQIQNGGITYLFIINLQLEKKKRNPKALPAVADSSVTFEFAL